MSASCVVAQLQSLTEKAEQLVLKLDKTYPSEEQWSTLGKLSQTLQSTARQIGNKILVLRNTRRERAWKDSTELRSQALARKGDLLTNGRLKSGVFRRNITAIFEGPKDSSFDSTEIKTRKATTRQRCEDIRQLSYDGVISWAIAFPPTLWAGGSMATDIFTCLLDDIEPDIALNWPSVIQDTLYKLRADEMALQTSVDFNRLLKGKFAHLFPVSFLLPI